MNVLRFPIQIRTGKNEFLRSERLKQREENEKLREEQRNFLHNETNLCGSFLFLCLRLNVKEKHRILSFHN